MSAIEKVVTCIKRNKKFLITTHTNLEGDALGSELAFYLILKKMGKHAVIVNDDDMPYGYDFLPLLKKIKKFNFGLCKIKFDCFVILDCCSLSR
ncbi:MAG: bifunctional oligoribonuclease/PAP phosphatase NrnA, partial [Candidatus Omnitrophica bacterium]|nr:bifunctional oligoribonuclease/PAP phosphatase NrnA [Candidatus Omnitrophota bacterium]